MVKGQTSGIRIPRANKGFQAIDNPIARIRKRKISRGTDGTVHAKTGNGNAIQSHRTPDRVFRIVRHKGGLGAAGLHPAVFPVALVEFVLTAFLDPGDLIYEPFCGSGTQIGAAESAGRQRFAMELDSIYCDVAVRRWELATGRKAKLVLADQQRN